MKKERAIQKKSNELKSFIYNRISYSIVFLSLLFILFSCDKEEEVYSCNPKINEWAKKYKNEFADISREQLVQVPIRYQNAIYQTLLPEKKLAFWQEKLDLVLIQENESKIREEVIKLKNSLKIDYYNISNGDSIPPEHRQFIKNWENEMFEKCGIDSAYFVVNFCTLMTFKEVDKLVLHSQDIDLSWLAGNHEIEIDNTVPPGGGTLLSDCECIYDIYCSLFLIVDCDNKARCKKTNGCGVTGTSICTGFCDNSFSKGEGQ